MVRTIVMLYLRLRATVGIRLVMLVCWRWMSIVFAMRRNMDPSQALKLSSLSKWRFNRTNESICIHRCGLMGGSFGFSHQEIKHRALATRRQVIAAPLYRFHDHADSATCHGNRRAVRRVFRLVPVRSAERHG
jgi:hypothetical protein